ncbi:MAG TPA: hypothetical protein VMJ30_09170, partial [Gemmatimonadales bacterium]|nr:hypothetical protein [Gemmatimonadales bacterium]
HAVVRAFAVVPYCAAAAQNALIANARDLVKARSALDRLLGRALGPPIEATDSQHPFAMVIVGGLFSPLLISDFLMPVLCALVSREGDRLEA